MSDQFFYIDAANERIGPISRDVLEQLHRSGTVTDETLVATESESEWMSFGERASREGPTTAPSATGTLPADGPRSTNRKKPKKKVGKIERIAIRTILGFIAFLILFAIFLNSPLVNWSVLHQPIAGSKALDPEKMPMFEIANSIETMPRWHLPVPDSSGEDEGYMLLFTGEDSVQVRAIPNHPGLYQIDLTQYAVVYDDPPKTLGSRNALTLRLNLGTQFENGRWELLEGKGSSVDQISKPGQVEPDQTTNDMIPLEEVMWHGQWVIKHLNGQAPDDDILAHNAQGYAELEQAFSLEHNKIEAIRAQGVRLLE